MSHASSSHRATSRARTGSPRTGPAAFASGSPKFGVRRGDDQSPAVGEHAEAGAGLKDPAVRPVQRRAGQAAVVMVQDGADAEGPAGHGGMEGAHVVRQRLPALDWPFGSQYVTSRVTQPGSSVAGSAAASDQVAA
jgi:hypothetical protein